MTARDTTKLTNAQIAWRAAQDIADGAYVNLGIGFPEMVAKFQPEGNDGKPSKQAISDSAIVSGLIFLALRVYSGRSAQEILDTEPSYIQDIGLAQLTPEQIGHLRSRYQPFHDQSCVDEILRWLDGEYVFDPDCLTD